MGGCICWERRRWAGCWCGERREGGREGGRQIYRCFEKGGVYGLRKLSGVREKGYFDGGREGGREDYWVWMDLWVSG